MLYNIIFLVSACIGLAFYFLRQRYSFWKRFNVPYIEPTFPFGNIRNLGKTIHAAKLFEKYYNELKGSGQFGGLYFFISPTVLATNLDFVKNVLIKDFNHFVSRGVYYNEEDDPLSGHLFALDGEKWRGLRSKLSPTFTSGKMKFMFPIIVGVADELKNTIDSLIVSSTGEFEIKEVLARFTTDVIGSCAFGIECNSLKNENSDFRKYGKLIFASPRNSFLKVLFMSMFRNWSRKLGMKVVADDVSEFFIASLKDTIKYREENNIKRNDFLNMMMQLMKQGKLDDEEETTKGILSFNETAANCFVFFVAGFETSSTTMMFCLFELSVNPDIQRKARQEVNDVLEKHGGQFTYDAMMKMHYLDRCVQEALRKYPTVPLLIRQCTKDYPVPNNDVTIPKGTSVLIPVYGIHHDPQIYSNPEVYDPERFLPEEVQKRHSLSYLPFGDGPRNCIGLRFGLMQTKVGLATILKNFQLSPCSKSTNPLVIDAISPVLAPEGGLWLNVKKIEELFFKKSKKNVILSINQKNKACIG
ncbi:putative cytochrome P450 6a14, partial [Pseudolycoriella hygida]